MVTYLEQSEIWLLVLTLAPFKASYCSSRSKRCGRLKSWDREGHGQTRTCAKPYERQHWTKKDSDVSAWALTPFMRGR